MIKCQLCDREFESLKSLGLHLSHTHKDVDHKDYFDKYVNMCSAKDRPSFGLS